MQLLTFKSRLVCAHMLGKVKLKHSQSFVRVSGAPVLVENDPEGCEISGCPNVGPTIKPCTHTLRVKEGYSSLLRIEGKRVCLDSLLGLTDGTPPGTVKYKVNDPEQTWVRES